MSISDELRPVCALAYQRARALAKEDEAAVPAPMRHFLHMAAQTPRSLTVARQVLETDPAFRAKVMEDANDATVGTAGYTWLRRLEAAAAIPPPPEPPRFDSGGNLAVHETDDMESVELRRRVRELEGTVSSLQAKLATRTLQWRQVLRELSAAMEQIPEDQHEQIIDLRDPPASPSASPSAAHRAT